MTKNIKQCYPMMKNPRGKCLIMNIYQIEGLSPRRWSDRDTVALQILFDQLFFDVHVYTDSTHDLTSKVIHTQHTIARLLLPVQSSYEINSKSRIKQKEFYANSARVCLTERARGGAVLRGVPHVARRGGLPHHQRGRQGAARRDIRHVQQRQLSSPRRQTKAILHPVVSRW